MTVRKHERDYADIRRHLRDDHGVDARGSVKLSTFLRHRTLHTKNVTKVQHTHAERSTKP